MHSKTLIGMALAAVVLAALGLTLDSRRDSRAAWAKANTALFPELRTGMERAARLRIVSVHGSTTVERTDAGWVVAERSGFPGRSDEVARLLTGLAEARRLEPKTANPELYGKLGLGGFEDEESQTVRLTVEDEGGAVLADLFIGRRNYRGAVESWYVREPDEDKTWSVEAKLRTPMRPSEWLDKDLFDVPRDRIAEVEITQPEGEPVRLVRPEPTAAFFEIENLPAERQPKSERSGAAFLGSLASMKLDDVKSRDATDFPTEGVRRTTWWTSDGLEISAELAEVPVGDGSDGEEDPDTPPATELLCRFRVGIDEQRLAGAEMGPAPPEPEEDPEAEAEDDPFAADDEAPEPRTRAELEEVVATIRSRIDGWVFVLPTWKKSSFLTDWDDLLEPLPEPEPEPQQPATETDAPADDGAGGDD